MINSQEKKVITEVLDYFGPEKVLKALSRGPVRADWSTCFLACVYGEKGTLHKASMVPLRTADDVVLELLGITLPQLSVVIGVFDTDTLAFLELVEEWLELNVVKVESPAAVGV